MNAETAHGLITRTPGVCGGKPCVGGRRVRVQDVVILDEEAGLSPDEICEQLPLTLAEVHAALSYYYDHREEVRREIAESEQAAERFRRDHPGSGR